MLISLLIGSFSLVNGQHTDRSRQGYEAAVRKINSEDWNGALTELNTVIKSHPEFCEGWLTRGVVHHYKKEYEKAIQDYNRSLVCYPGYPMAFFNRGVTRLAMGDHYGALRDFSNASEKMPEHVPTLYNRAWTFLQLGDTVKAQQGLQACLSLNEGYIPALLMNAVLHRLHGDSTETIRNYQKILKAEDQASIARYNLAHLYYQRGEIAAAKEEFIRLGKEYPDDMLIQLHAGAVFSLSGNQAEACRYWQRAAQAGSPEALVLIKRYCPGE